MTALQLGIDSCSFLQRVVFLGCVAYPTRHTDVGCGLISVTVIACDSFKFQKRRQFFIATNDKPLSVVAVRVRNPDRLPVGINR